MMANQKHTCDGLEGLWVKRRRAGLRQVCSNVVPARHKQHVDYHRNSLRLPAEDPETRSCVCWSTLTGKQPGPAGVTHHFFGISSSERSILVGPSLAPDMVLVMQLMRYCVCSVVGSSSSRDPSGAHSGGPAHVCNK